MFAAMRVVDGPFTVVSGLRLGAEQLGAEAALEQECRSSPCCHTPSPTRRGRPNPAGASPDWSRRRRTAITLDRKSPTSKQAAGMALGKRDDWLARQVDAAVVVWDQEDRDVGRLVQVLEDQLGADQVLFVQP